ncbi:MAG: phage holin family protein [Cellvibrionaceae bacterium]
MGDKTTSFVSYVMACFTAIAGLSINEWMMIFGIATWVISYWTNLYFKKKHLLLAQEKQKQNL